MNEEIEKIFEVLNENDIQIFYYDDLFDGFYDIDR